MADEDVSGQEDNTNSTGDDQATDTNSNETLLGNENQDQSKDENTEGNQAEDTKGDDEGKEENQVPEAYEFTMPEGMELDQAMADAATPIFKELGLNQEQANKLVEVYANQLGAQVKAQEDSFAQQLETWATELKNDKDVGGEAFEKNTGIARQAIEKFGSKELMALMDSTGIGNNPAMFKFALEIGKHLVEDQPGSGNPPSQEQSAEQRLYPNEAQAS